MEKTEQKKQWETKLVNRVDKSEWVFPTKAVGNISGIVVEMICRDPETGEGHGTVLVKDGDRHEGQFKKTWQLQNFTPVDGDIVKVEKVTKAK